MRDWTAAEKMGKISVSIIEKLTRAFHIESNKPDGEKNYDLMIKLSQATAYQTTVYSSLQKNHEYERRLQRVEKTVKGIDPSDLAMKNSPILSAEEEMKSKEKLR